MEIIDISSTSAFRGASGLIHYAASKGAVITMTYAMAAELGDYNICVNSVSPGFTISEAALLLRPLEQAVRTAQAKQEIKRPLYPHDFTGTIAFLASDDADMITGQTIVVDGGEVKH